MRASSIAIANGMRCGNRNSPPPAATRPRQDFDVIEEARAVQALVEECGRADHAAEHLHKTKGWVSQRLSLLQLAPELQTALRRGELAIREARTLARVPLEQQVHRWRAAQEREQDKGRDGKPAAPRPSLSRAIAAAVTKFDTEPQLLANALRDQLGESGQRICSPR